MKKIVSRSFETVFVVVLLLSTLPIMIKVTKGQPSAPAFWVEPAAVNFDTDNATFGTTFNVTVWGSVAVETLVWLVQLGFDSSELQAVSVDYMTGTANEFFAGHPKIVAYPSIDNEAGTVAAGEYVGPRDRVGPTSGSLFYVTFEIIAAPTQGQSITSLIDPSCRTDSEIMSCFIDTDYNRETPLSTVPCRYTYCDSTVWSPNPTFVYCSPNPVRANRSVTCVATVSGLDPTGTVTWLTNSSTGYANPPVSYLSSGNCSTTYIDTSPGIATITACYNGDSNNVPSNASTMLKVKPQAGPSWTYVYCSSDFAYVNSPVTISASVSSSDQTGIIPTGTITWSTDSNTGSFTPPISTLTRSCSTTYIDTSPGMVTITASYSGDLFNDPSQCSISLEVRTQPVVPPAFLLDVPYHHQSKSYYCGPAALEEVFHYYGPDIPQKEIADVARTASDGTYTCDMVRAAHFSSLSTSVGRESSVNYTGYTARKLGYAALEYGGMTIEELKSVIAQGYPVIVLTTWHFRVAVGYNDEFIIFQDPYYGTLFKMDYSSFSADWDYSGHWGLLISPWQVDITNSHNVLPGDEFNVMATITYPWVEPFYQYWPQATSVNASITLPSGLILASGETAQKAFEIPVFGPGESFNVSWTVEAQTLGNYRIGVEAEGLVNGFMPSLPNGYSEYAYEDRIGGSNKSTVAVTSSLDVSPPVTVDDYDGLWHNQSFTVNLPANDDMSGVVETFYRYNNGSRRAVSLSGQPTIETSNMNNTLEYWSIDWAGNEEFPHKFLTGIKLDLTKPVLCPPVQDPVAEVQPHEPASVSVYVTDEVSGTKDVTLQYSLDSGTTWVFEAMTLDTTTGLYEACIPGQPAGTLVKYRLTACDWAGNSAVQTDSGQDYSYQVPFLEATVIPDRETLNLGCSGYWLMFRIELPEAYSVGDIDISSLKLNGTVTADSSLSNIMDLGSSEIQELAACFNRTLVTQFVLSSGVTTGNVTLSFKGTLNDSSVFEGTCTLGVRMRGDTNLDGRVDMQDIAIMARAFGSFQGQPRYKTVLDENEDNCINLKDIALVAKNFGNVYL